MKNFLYVCVVCAVCFYLGRGSRLIGVSAQSLVEQDVGVCATFNGNVDASDERLGQRGRNLNDAIYLLNWLFLGGPEPKPFCLPNPSSHPCALPATGQREMFGISPGQDGEHQAGCPMENRFFDNGDGTISDFCTGLMWRQRTVDVNGDGLINSDDRLNWWDCLQYCDSLVLASDRAWLTPDLGEDESAFHERINQSHRGVKYDDWRVPNVRELQSIIDYSKARPANPEGFDVEDSTYWSSTTWIQKTANAWTVSLGGGATTNTNDNGKTNLKFFMAVRDL